MREAPLDLLELARLVRRARTDQGLTQVDLGGLANVGERFVVELEQAKPTLAIGKTINVLEALGLRLIASARSSGLRDGPR